MNTPHVSELVRSVLCNVGLQQNPNDRQAAGKRDGGRAVGTRNIFEDNMYHRGREGGGGAGPGLGMLGRGLIS